MASKTALQAFQQGVAAYSTGSYETAIEFFTTAITQDEKLVKAYDARAKAYEKLGRSRDALLDAKRVIERLPDSFRGYLLAGRLWKGLGMTDQAQRMLELGQSKAAKDSKDFQTIERELEAVQLMADQAIARNGPIAQLPLELLLQVFTIARESEAIKPSSARLNPIVVASHVCRQWRSLVNSTPMLWNTLNLDCARRGARALEKAKFWACRSTGRVPDDEDEMTVLLEARRGPGITNLTLSELEHLTAGTFSLVMNQLESLDAMPKLEQLSCSWLKPQQTKPASRQLRILFEHLVRCSTRSLRSLSLRLPSVRLFVHFSLPRFCHHFTALETLELRSLPFASTSARELTLESDFLPAYNNEEDWLPSSISTLCLVGPIWRLKYADGTLASPVITPSDVPRLRHLELGLTVPCISWKLFSAPALRSLKINNHPDLPNLPDPSVDVSFNSLESLIILDSKPLADRFLRLLVEKNVNFPVLKIVHINLPTLSSSILSLFNGKATPHLETLRLPNSISSSIEKCELPTSFPSLKVLDLENSSWIESDHLTSLSSSSPLLERVKLTSIESPISRGVMNLVQSRKQGLKNLDLNGCKGIEPKALEWIQTQLPANGKGIIKFALINQKELKGKSKVWREVGT